MTCGDIMLGEGGPSSSLLGCDSFVDADVAAFAFSTCWICRSSSSAYPKKHGWRYVCNAGNDW